MKPTGLAIAALCALLLGTGLLGAGYVLDAERRLLLEQGEETEARVLRTYRHGRPGQESLRAELQPLDQPGLTLRASLDRQQYDRLREGDTLALIYLASQPSVDLLGGRAKAQALDLRVSVAIAVGALLLLSGAGGLLVLRRR